MNTSIIYSGFVPELVGRDRECSEIARLLANVCTGAGVALAVVGEPGIGKTALLDHTISTASDVTVLRTRGSEVESGLAFAAVADILGPLASMRTVLPARQRKSLEQALCLRDGQCGDEFAVCVATLGVLAAAALRRPLLVCVDDAHLVDPPSRTALLFAARRLAGQPIMILFGARPTDAINWPDQVQVIKLTGLDRKSSCDIVIRASPIRPAPAVLERLFVESGGNPLALLEIPTQLSTDQLTGAEHLPEPLPAAPSLDRIFRTRIKALPAATRRALLISAVSGQPDMNLLGQAFTVVHVSIGDLEPAEDAGLIQLDGRQVTFRHPLIRAAVCASASPTQRRAAHRAVAVACDGPYALERRAYHLAAAAIGVDDDVADLLDQAGAAAGRRGGHLLAASTFHRAAQLGQPGPSRARRLVAAARSAQFANQWESSKHLLEQALSQHPDQPERVDARRMLADALVWTGQARSGHLMLLAETEELQRTQPQRAAMVLAHAALPCFLTRDIGAAMTVARRAYELANGPDPAPRFAASAALAAALVYAGKADDGIPLLEQAVGLATHDVDPVAMGMSGVGHAGMIANCLLWLVHLSLRGTPRRRENACRSPWVGGWAGERFAIVD